MSIPPSENKALQRGNNQVKNKKGQMFISNVTQIQSSFVFKTIKMIQQLKLGLVNTVCKPYFNLFGFI